MLKNKIIVKKHTPLINLWSTDLINRSMYMTGKFVLPTWCDSHTHIVYAGNRELEFVDRINGLTYEEIANRGGGILNSAKTRILRQDLQKLSKNRSKTTSPT